MLNVEEHEGSVSYCLSKSKVNVCFVNQNIEIRRVQSHINAISYKIFTTLITTLITI